MFWFARYLNVLFAPLGIRWQIFRFTLKIVSCVLYVVRSIQDTEPDLAGGLVCVCSSMKEMIILQYLL